MFNYDLEKAKVLDEVGEILEYSRHCGHVEIHITLDADKPYAEINLESYKMLHGLQAQNSNM